MNRIELERTLSEWIEEENLDIMSVLDSRSLAHMVVGLRNRLELYKTKVVHDFFVAGDCKYYIKLNNSYKGFVSVSTCDETSVSRTEYYPYKADEEGDEIPALLNLASMINEAWFNLVA